MDGIGPESCSLSEFYISGSDPSDSATSPVQTIEMDVTLAPFNVILECFL